LALSDKRYDNTQVLFSCIQAIKEYFSEVMYIGEPLYITRIYEILNRIEGVIDVKNVKINNVLGGVYSNASLNMKSILSKDGTYYKVPKNVILELRFPSLDIKGTVK
jgi:hypothetical protein